MSEGQGKNTPDCKNAAWLLCMEGISKSFAGVHALKEVDFQLQRHEVHVLVGENGAGKSTLMHLLAGVHRPDTGTISINGKTVTIENEKRSQELGIGMVFQEGSLVESLSIAENIFAARQPANRWGIVNYRKLYRQTKELLEQFGMDLDPMVCVEMLSPAQRQRVEIAKALSLDARIVIFDEPTSSLTPSEVTPLFELLGRLKARGVGIIYISHRLEEVFAIADRITVLKDGQYCGTFAKANITRDQLVSCMVGREFLEDMTKAGDAPPGSDVVLKVEELSDDRYLHRVSFSAHRGEVTAFAGLAGAGRSELALTIMGARPRRSGRIKVCGRTVTINCPKDAISAGLGYLPEDRRQAGLFVEMSIRWNVTAASLSKFGTWWMDDRKAARTANDYCRKLRVSAPDAETTIQMLSGGNQQKVLLARWLLLEPDILIVDEPTRGIDVGAKQEVHRLLHKLARQGTCVIMISSELPEILAVADRIYVMREGQIVGQMTHRQATEERIMRYALGA